MESEISFSDPVLAEVFLNEHILTAVQAYYGGQPYFRNLILGVETTNKGKPEYVDPLFSLRNMRYVLKHRKRRLAHALQFHTDYPSQISLMFLVNDVDDRCTHMEFAVGAKTHPSQHDVDDDVVYGRYEIKRCTGPRGTLFVFDNGNHLHKAVHRPNTTRKMLHTSIMQEGHFIYGRGQEPAGADFSFLGSKPDVVRRSLEKLMPANGYRNAKAS